MKRSLNIMLVDDHSLFREGLKLLLSGSEMISNIMEAVDGIDFLKQIEISMPDIVLMDIDMPNMNGIEASKKALLKYPQLKIIALSMYADENFYTEMIEVGAKGFLLKNSRFHDVKLAIEDVFNGRNYFSPEILTSIVKNINRKNSTSLGCDLTNRELEVLLLVCKGLSNQEIGDKLFISKRTVDKHRENILLKTDCKNTAELVVFAIKNGYFEI